MSEMPKPEAPNFLHKSAILATMHRKEQAIAPVLMAELGMQVRVPEGFNSDLFGTFTREVARPGSQIEAARQKVFNALEMTGERLGLASEGTFGPHPVMPWMACDREVVLLCDRTSGLEIIGEAVSSETNYRQQRVTAVAEAFQFAQQAGFPDHGLVVMPDAAQSPKHAIYKGITTAEQLEAAVERTLTQNGSAWVETDMRALYNPTRMKVIAQATRNLVEKVRCTCPNCHWPGFDVRQRIPGLPCERCGAPTLLLHSLRYGCQHCGHQTTLSFPEGKTHADPGQCEYCNP
ncbi:MAG TPA: DUF6671 family protein [Trichocoleus sp.]